MLFAALVWGGNTTAGGSLTSTSATARGTAANSPTPANAGQVKLMVPGLEHVHDHHVDAHQLPVGQHRQLPGLRERHGSSAGGRQRLLHSRERADRDRREHPGWVGARHRVLQPHRSAARPDHLQRLRHGRRRQRRRHSGQRFQDPANGRRHDHARLDLLRGRRGVDRRPTAARQHDVQLCKTSPTRCIRSPTASPR